MISPQVVRIVENSWVFRQKTRVNSGEIPSTPHIPLGLAICTESDFCVGGGVESGGGFVIKEWKFLTALFFRTIIELSASIPRINEQRPPPKV